MVNIAEFCEIIMVYFLKSCLERISSEAPTAGISMDLVTHVKRPLFLNQNDLYLLYVCSHKLRVLFSALERTRSAMHGTVRYFKQELSLVLCPPKSQAAIGILVGPFIIMLRTCEAIS